MCTVSWLRHDACGYELFCNRDERLTRKAASSPAVCVRSGVRYVAPVDGDFGGSWVGVNEFGLTLCLLNNYDERPAAPAPDQRSRGLLLTALMDCRSVAQVRARLSEASDLSHYRPFTMLVLAPGVPAFAARWADSRLTFEDNPAMPLTSSSFDGGRVCEARKNLFRRMGAAGVGVSVEMLRLFHRSHEPARGPFSVCMHREDAATVSFSRVRVGERLVEFEYRSQSPCSDARPVNVVLPRAGAEL